MDEKVNDLKKKKKGINECSREHVCANELSCIDACQGVKPIEETLFLKISTAACHHENKQK